MLQEVGAIPDLLRHDYSVVVRAAVGKTGRALKFGTAILVRGTLEDTIQLSSEWDWVNKELLRFQGNLVAQNVCLRSGKRYRVVSIHSPAWPVDPKRLEDVDVQPVKLRNSPKVWVTELAWAALRSLCITHEPCWVVGGDLNASVTFDDLSRGGPRGNQEVLDRMKALGLVECLSYVNGGLVPTFRNPRGGAIVHQIDHLFVSSALAARLVSCTTGARLRVFEDSVSDHLPIVADFSDA